MKTCIKCGHSLADEAVFCEECGTKQPIGAVVRKCSNCGAEVDANAKFCPECGTPITSSASPNAVSAPSAAPESAVAQTQSPITQPDENTIVVNVKGIPFKLKYVKGRKYGRDEEMLDFFLGETPVTQALWMTVMGDNPSKDIDDLMYPVTNLTSSMATTFMVKLGKLLGVKLDLPTEEQWKFAYSGGNHSKGYTYSGSNNAEEVGWTDRKLHPVGELYANELGLFDMEGHVEELLKDNDKTYISLDVFEKREDSDLTGFRLAINIPLAELPGEQSPLKSILESFRKVMLQQRQQEIDERNRALEKENEINAAKSNEINARIADKLIKRQKEIAARQTQEAQKWVSFKAPSNEKDILIRAAQLQKQGELQSKLDELNEQIGSLEKEQQTAKDLVPVKDKELKEAQAAVPKSKKAIKLAEDDIEKYNHRFSVVLLKRVDYGLFNSKGQKFDELLIQLTGCTKEQIKDLNKLLKTSGKVIIGENMLREDARRWEKAIDGASGSAMIVSPYDHLEEYEEAELKEKIENTLASAKKALSDANARISRIEKEIEEAKTAASKIKSAIKKIEEQRDTVIEALNKIDFTFENGVLCVNTFHVVGSSFSGVKEKGGIIIYKDEDENMIAEELLPYLDPEYENGKFSWALLPSQMSDKRKKELLSGKFIDCKNLKYVLVPESVFRKENIRNMFVKCKNLNVDTLWNLKDGVGYLKVKGKYGLMRTDGTWIVEPKFTALGEFSEGLCPAAIKGKSIADDKWGYIDYEGNWAIDPKYESAKEFNCGVGIVRDEDGLYWLIDKGGNIINDQELSLIRGFYFGYSWAESEDEEHWGIIDTKGNWVIEPTDCFDKLFDDDDDDDDDEEEDVIGNWDYCENWVAKVAEQFGIFGYVDNGQRVYPNDEDKWTLRIALPEIYKDDSDPIDKLITTVEDVWAGKIELDSSNGADECTEPNRIVQYVPGDEIEMEFDEAFQQNYHQERRKIEAAIKVITTVVESKQLQWKPYFQPYFTEKEDILKYGLPAEEFDAHTVNYAVVNDEILVIVCDGEMPRTVSTRYKYLELGDEEENDNSWVLASEVDTPSFKEKITTVVVLGNFTHLSNSCFYEFDALKTVSLPDSTAEIGEYAFWKTEKLGFIILPSNLKAIKANAFYDCGLKSIKIPAGVTELGEDAFGECSDLEVALVPRTVKSFEPEAVFGDSAWV